MFMPCLPAISAMTNPQCYWKADNHRYREIPDSYGRNQSPAGAIICRTWTKISGFQLSSAEIDKISG